MNDRVVDHPATFVSGLAAFVNASDATYGHAYGPPASLYTPS